MLMHFVISVHLLYVARLARVVFGFFVSRLFFEDQFHSAFRAIAGMIHNDFGMHRARLFLSILFLLLMLVLFLTMRAIAVNRPYLRSGANRDHNCAEQIQHRYLLHAAGMFL